jgi:hypothetical protein
MVVRRGGRVPYNYQMLMSRGRELSVPVSSTEAAIADSRFAPVMRFGDSESVLHCFPAASLNFNYDKLERVGPQSGTTFN